MKEYTSMDEIQKDINQSYLMAKMKKDIERNQSKTKKFNEYFHEMIRFMYSKLNEEDRKHVDKLKIQMSEALSD